MTEDIEHCDSSVGLGRRRYLRGIGTVGGLAAIGAGVGGARGRSETLPDARPVLCDVDKAEPERFAVETHLEDPPGDRSGVVHVTSNGKRTTDYAHGMVSVEDRELTLGEVARDSRITYQYWEGERNENAAPDEVFLIVRTSENQVYAAYTTSNATPDSTDQSWATRNVSAEMRSSDRGWKDIQLSEENVSTASMIERTAGSLRDTGERFGDVVSRYGSDAQLVGVGFGVGWTTRQTVVDVSFDELSVTGDDGTTTYDFPAAVPMDVSLNQRGNGAVAVTLNFQWDEPELSLSDVNSGSVRMYPYGAVAPLDEGVTARGVNVSGDGLRTVFPAGQVRESFSSGSQRVIISGRFDVANSHYFAAVGTLELS